MDQPAETYQPPAPFAPPALRSAPLNEVFVLGGSTYSGSPTVPVPADAPPSAWSPGRGWVPAPRSAPGAGAGSVRRRTVAMVAAVATALVVVVTALALADPGPRRHTLTLPASAGDYVKVSTVSGTRMQTIFGRGGTFSTIATNDLLHAKIAIYGRGAMTSPTLLFIGFSATDSPDIGRELRTEDPSQVTTQVIDGAGPSAPPTSVDAGPLGGSLRCSPVLVHGLDAEVGVWADADTLGVVLLFDPALSPSADQTGSVARAFRSVAEH